MRTLGKLELFNRSPETGAVESVIWAERANYLPSGDWELSGVQTLPIEGADGEPRLALKASGPQLWKTTQTPQSIARLAAEPRDIALSDMRGFMQKGNSGSKPSFAYQFWYWHRITRPIAAFILLLCAAPIMQRTGRQDTGDKALIIGITLGFIFLIMDGAMATFAASGGVGTLYAITFPLVLFALGGLFMLLRTESLT